MSNHTNPNWTGDEGQEIELSEQDQADLAALTEEPINHTLLEIWNEVLGSIELSVAHKIPAIVANKVVSSWPKLSYQDTARYHARYHEILTEYRRILRELIEENPGCLKNIGERGTEFFDAEANRGVYKELIIRWKLYDQSLQLDWDAVDPESHIEIAAIADAAAFCIGSTGLIQHLGAPQIGFTQSSGDQEELEARLTEAAEARVV
jgi:hypothetical protein